MSDISARFTEVGQTALSYEEYINSFRLPIILPTVVIPHTHIENLVLIQETIHTVTATVEVHPYTTVTLSAAEVRTSNIKAILAAGIIFTLMII